MSIRKGQIIIAGAGNTRRNLGEVYYSQSSLATDNSGALPLWTGESVATAMYPSLTEWVTKHTELQCTAEEYENALSTYGECPKYVLSADSLRLPKLANYIKMANGIDGITQKEAGLPNITGSLVCNSNDFSGAIYSDSNVSGGSYYSAVNNPLVEFDASRSSAVYGKSDTVTPAHTTLYPWVYAFSAAIPASTAQAAEFQEGLSGKADTNLGNIPSNYDYVVERYDDEQGNWYEVWKSGRLRQGGVLVRATSATRINFFKPFANINYSIQVGARIGSGSGYTQGITKNTSTYFTYVSETSSDWTAEGQGA